MSVPRRSDGAFRGLLLPGIAVAIAGCRSSPIRTAEAGASPVHYVFANEAYGCDGGEDTALRLTMTEASRGLRSALGAPIDEVDSGRKLLEALAQADSRPLVIFYAGHARLTATVPPRTELCLADGPLEADTLLASIPARAPSAVVVLDACYSAYVDVRKSPVDTAVITASPDVVEGSGRTVLANAVEDALRGGDANGDGIVDDAELVQAMQDTLGPAMTRHGPLLQLRRQAWDALPVVRGAASGGPMSPRTPLLRGRKEPSVFWGVGEGLASPEGTAPTVQGDPLELARLARSRSDAEGFAIRGHGPVLTLVSLRLGTEMLTFPASRKGEVVARVEAGDWARWGQDEGEPEWIWHGGRVATRIITVDGRDFDGASLLATPCDEVFGQCFIVSTKQQAHAMSGREP